MSTIIERLRERAAEEVVDPKWVAGAVEAGRSELENMPATLRPAGQRVLDVLERRQADIADVGHARFVSVMARIDLGQHDEARLEWLANSATFDEQDDELDRVDGASVRAREASDEAWAKLRSVALEVLREGGRVALPLILAAL